MFKLRPGRAGPLGRAPGSAGHSLLDRALVGANGPARVATKRDCVLSVNPESGECAAQTTARRVPPDRNGSQYATPSRRENGDNRDRGNTRAGPWERARGD